jgi:DNA repair protein RecN (Recombination protein N)
MKTNLTIKSLTLKNFATFSHSEVLFSEGFNCIVGETGSGKSLVLDALEMIFGGRGDKKFIRKGADFLLLECLLSTDNNLIISELNDLGYPCNGSEITLKRIIYKNGSSKTFINQSACSLSELAHFSRQHIDLVGQFENQKLLTDSYMLKIIDGFGKHEEVVSFRENYLKLSLLKKEETELLKNKNALAQRKDYLEFQINEITTLAPSEDDEISLIQKKDKIVNLEKYHQLENQIQHLLNGTNEESGLVQNWNQLKQLIIKNSNFFKPQLAQLSLSLDHDLNDFFDKLNFSDSSELTKTEVDEVFQRLDYYQKVKKKFGLTISDILLQLNSFEEELLLLNSSQDRLEDVQGEIKQLDVTLKNLAVTLHEKRIITSNRLSSELTKSIQEMRMQGAVINIRCFLNTELNDEGLTSLSFEAQTNPGEGYYKVKDIASGGELSRILLAYRSILSNYDSVSIFLFDEIDTGIGGETALTIAKSLKKVALSSQVIAITHLPQIAIHADHLVEVDKELIEEGSEVRTESFIKHFNGDKIKSIAEKMIALN